MPIALKSLPPAVEGASYARALQGVNVDGTTPTAGSPAPFLQSDTLTCTVSLGQDLPSIIAPTVAWISPTLAQVSLAITPTQMGMLDPDNDYLLEIFASRSSDKWPIVAGYLPVLPSAGSQANATPPDLVSITYVGRLLGQLGLTESALEIVPSLITAVSGAIRSYCNRNFTQAIVVENLPVEFDGSIRLAQIPVAAVRRIQARPEVAITISNTSAVASWVNQETTGDPITGLAATGLVLNWQQAGSTYSATFPYAAGLTIAGLAARINAADWGGATITGSPPGSPPYGWSAAADDTLGSFAASDLFDGGTARGASVNDDPTGGAEFGVFASDVGTGYPHPDDGEKTGIWYVGRRGWGGRTGGRAWGWGWGDGMRGRGDGMGIRGAGGGLVRVTYLGGLSQVPPDIARAAAEMVNLEIQRLRTDFMLTSETALGYSYTLNQNMLDAYPSFVKNALNSWRISNA